MAFFFSGKSYFYLFILFFSENCFHGTRYVFLGFRHNFRNWIFIRDRFALIVHKSESFPTCRPIAALVVIVVKCARGIRGAFINAAPAETQETRIVLAPAAHKIYPARSKDYSRLEAAQLVSLEIKDSVVLSLLSLFIKLCSI